MTHGHDLGAVLKWEPHAHRLCGLGAGTLLSSAGIDCPAGSSGAGVGNWAGKGVPKVTAREQGSNGPMLPDVAARVSGVGAAIWHRRASTAVQNPPPPPGTPI